MIKYKITDIKQEHKGTCGVGTLRMILNYYGVKTSENDLIKKIVIHSTGTWFCDLAYLALINGLEATVYSINTLLFKPSTAKFSQSKLLKYFKDSLKKLKRKNRKKR